jgi:hypothetical protein
VTQFIGNLLGRNINHLVDARWFGGSACAAPEIGGSIKALPHVARQANTGRGEGLPVVLLLSAAIDAASFSRFNSFRRNLALL